MFDFARKALFAALLAGVAGPAIAADYYEPPVDIPPPPVVGGWYIRGHIGMSNQHFDGLTSSLYLEPSIAAYGWHDSGGFSSAPIFGGGVGYQFNDYLRGDLTVEYRGKSDFEALDWVDDGTVVTTNDFRAKKSEWLFLANAYADVGTFYGITPYVGAGIGASRNTISNFRDINIITGGGAYADEETKWNFAWALHTGIGIKATDRMTIDLGYSFVSLGHGQTGVLQNDDPAFDIPNDGFKFNDLYSHDLKLGVRYSLN
ncbi:MAG: outer membrane beta-barrel protein [Alphaproteobacteria bacterium]|nr:outer membrane beta-barrel protein [Alphaproteobacteria bacterium]MBU0805601.1 outer membrane beta-barrel protein [Alphaproteobacteria bacterium]MBU0873547.1 outer membrane beta-barrel protein [Alphaproteobacteria bacterium]MBU1401225.1 outer membrane beta-barrel protein [Alphaproteobacteria bacterium]MBU1592358.1 outer membrane beta-barrel protein [Alphaproteobacteria bacterium]